MLRSKFVIKYQNGASYINLYLKFPIQVFFFSLKNKQAKHGSVCPPQMNFTLQIVWQW